MATMAINLMDFIVSWFIWLVSGCSRQQITYIGDLTTPLCKYLALKRL